MKKKKRLISLSVIFFLIGGIIGISFLSFVIRSISGVGSQNILYFTIMHFSGYLFFIFAPVEFLYVFMLRKGANIFLVFLIAILTGVFGHLIDYLVGRSVSKVFVKHMIGRKRYRKTKKTLHKYGNVAIFISSLFPLSSPVVVLVSGMVEHKYNRVFLNGFSGLILKYLVISLFFV